MAAEWIRRKVAGSASPICCITSYNTVINIAYVFRFVNRLKKLARFPKAIREDDNGEAALPKLRRFSEIILFC